MKIKKYIKSIIIVFLFLSICYPIPCGTSPKNENVEFEIKRLDFYYRAYNSNFSEELLKECLYYEKIKNSDIVLIQARLETGYYNSELFKVAHNCFGMRLAHLRKTTAIGEYNYHAQYTHWTESVKDYKLWQEFYESRGYNIDEEYLTFLKYIRYATDRHYIKKLIAGLDGYFT